MNDAPHTKKMGDSLGVSTGVKVTYPPNLRKHGRSPSKKKIRNHKPINLKSNNPIAKLDGLKISGELELEKSTKNE